MRFSRSGVRSGGWAGRGSLSPFDCLLVACIGVMRGDRYELGNHWLQIQDPLQVLFLPGSAPVAYALRRISRKG